MNIKVERRSLPPVFLHGRTINPYFQLVRIKGIEGARLSYLGDSENQLSRLRTARIFKLPAKIQFMADAILNAGLKPSDWLGDVSTKALFAGGVRNNLNRTIVIASNAGNAPLHDFEANYDALNHPTEPLAAKDFEVDDKPGTSRRYFCVTDSSTGNIDIQYVTFDEEGKPRNRSLNVAVGGRPLIVDGSKALISEILTTSISDPRHVIALPEMKITDTTFLPIGLRNIQRDIREGKVEEIMERIRSGAPLLISLEEERETYNGITPELMLDAFKLFGWPESDYGYDLSKNVLHMKVKYNYYRHTFWAKTGNEITIGIVGNDLGPNFEPQDKEQDKDMFTRALKPIGTTIPQLQDFLAQELKAEQAVLMGNGKDPRIYISETPHHEDQWKIFSDNDIRDAMTAGLLAINL